MSMRFLDSLATGPHALLKRLAHDDLQPAPDRLVLKHYNIQPQEAEVIAVESPTSAFEPAATSR